MKEYKNLSRRSGVKAYEYDKSGFTFITVQFKDGSIYSYTIDTCGLGNVFEMISLADMGRGLHRHINYYKPNYILGRVDNIQPHNVETINYPSLSVKNIKWDTDNKNPQWFRVEYKTGQSTTYTIENTNAKTINKLIELAKKGYGLLAYMKELKAEGKTNDERVTE